LQKKKDALVTGDISILDEIVLLEQTYIMKMESLENKREKLLLEDGLAGATINNIIDITDEEYAGRYREIYVKLSDVITKLKKINLLNQKLLKERLSVISRLARPWNQM
jgi:hypothetical protein